MITFIDNTGIFKIKDTEVTQYQSDGQTVIRTWSDDAIKCSLHSRIVILDDGIVMVYKDHIVHCDNDNHVCMYDLDHLDNVTKSTLSQMCNSRVEAIVTNIIH